MLNVSLRPSFSSTSVSLCCSSSTLSHSNHFRRKWQHRGIVCAVPARDILIDFGKHSGSMMGTLPSSYLRWLVRELRDGKDSMWAAYAQQVLEDPHYKDRLEFEVIQRLSMKGDLRKSGIPSDNSSARKSMIALGWDLTDRDGWSKLNFSLLGTSHGGRIPRKEVSEVTAIKKNRVKKSSMLESTESESKSLTLKEELMRRRQLRRERTLRASSKSKGAPKQNSVFPGRDAMLSKVQSIQVDE